MATPASPTPFRTPPNASSDDAKSFRQGKDSGVVSRTGAQSGRISEGEANVQFDKSKKVTVKQDNFCVWLIKTIFCCGSKNKVKVDEVVEKAELPQRDPPVNIQGQPVTSPRTHKLMSPTLSPASAHFQPQAGDEMKTGYVSPTGALAASSPIPLKSSGSFPRSTKPVTALIADPRVGIIRRKEIDNKTSLEINKMWSAFLKNLKDFSEQMDSGKYSPREVRVLMNVLEAFASNLNGQIMELGRAPGEAGRQDSPEMMLLHHQRQVFNTLRHQFHERHGVLAPNDEL